LQNVVSAIKLIDFIL